MMKLMQNSGRKGQVFSVDVLLVLLPITLIFGASLQYLFLAEEQMASIAQTNQREMMAQGAAAYAMAKYHAETRTDAFNCFDIDDYLGDVELPSGYDYHIQIGSDSCDSAFVDFDPFSKYMVNNPTGSETRFGMAPDTPGEIAELSITVWDGNLHIQQ